ncbi:polysaccharide deacetylase family protein [Alteromonas macleodii]|jgi:peptidoglycan/xylan/chitin deacetylase (PgdA/CDA1 family)|uniref:polysaccharide deacetylase family protein n=1 Tax=Alteromonas macleodii TaxID=28108 RepID=UPI00085928E5|nr:polysaccharide deacetylase family protein [Alteromonas macleodii]MAC10300.1 polysaccharide deacetylase [Alteromonas sp.]MEC9334112.1 polysaccharide deacetylase family protein [Pseudomonadota bacterium]NKX31503.1 polysaccharide deacetylase family protein [Alteromonadaceae bacterium A_SAG1]MEE3028560.1 polysaccharide deacetylase family protein [Pseudomonadota bacterium]OES27355.1 polysaccharide deacetylase family protein [Alteromonas macleodii]
MLLNLIRHSVDDDMKTNNVIQNRTTSRTRLKILSSMLAGIFNVLLVSPSIASGSDANPVADATSTTKEQSGSNIDSSVSTTPNAAILLYHHVSSSTPASTSISPEAFKSHMEYLDAHHTVVSLQDVVSAIQHNTTLPENAVAITFDDGYANILDNAHPILADLGFPYTVFINPDEIGVGPKQLTWEQVIAMHNDGVVFANHTLDHLHMLNGEQAMGERAWLEKVWQNVESAEKKIEDKLDISLKYLAYPFGEYNTALANKLKAEGYIGFGQHSGAVGPSSDMQALPRFPAAGPYANLATLKTKLNSLAMPVTQSSHKDPRMTARNLSSPISLTIDSDDVRLTQVNCFFGGDPIETSLEENVLTFTLDETLPVGRSRVNCTAPSNAQSGRYYWYSTPFFVADENGNYPD